MLINDDFDQNAGGAAGDNSDFSDTGDQGGNLPDNSGNPDGQNGRATNDGQPDELAKYKAEVRRLNKAVLDARRSNGNRSPENQNNADGMAFDTPEGQYGIALEIATSRLSRKLEDRISLYPELPASEISRIRKNPWAFASLESYQSGNFELAADEIEQAMYDRAMEIEAEKQNNPNGQDNGNGTVRKVPAQVNMNQADEPPVDAVPGTDEDVNPWTMPMNKLEKEKNKTLYRQQNRKS